MLALRHLKAQDGGQLRPEAAALLPAARSAPRCNFTMSSHVLKTRVDEGKKGPIPAINSCGYPPSEFLKHGSVFTIYYPVFDCDSSGFLCVLLVG